MDEQNNYMVPTVIEKSGNGERAYDIYSRLLKDRIIFLGSGIDDAVANTIIAQLLFLAAQGDEDITMYVNSPGGSVSAAMAIYDTMQHVGPDVRTTCVGMAASAGAFLLTAGAAGKRTILPHAEVMIHQPLGGTQGQASDIDIHAKHILKTKALLNKLIAKHTGQKVSRVEQDTDRDNFLSAKEAVAYGLVDKIVK